MILSPYRNPPYRTPTPQGASPGPHSPKRKLNDDSQVPPPPTNPVNDPRDNQIGRINSPRLQVTEQLKDLNIQQPNAVGVPTERRRPIQRKRLKRNPAKTNIVEGGNIRVTRTPEHAECDINESGMVREVEETPHCRARVQSSPLRSVVIPDEPAGITEGYGLFEDQPSKALQTPPSSPMTTTDLHNVAVVDVDLFERSVSPLPFRGELTPDQAALTWQEDEITGHDVHPESGDDGEGINGIGFKPTPSIAFARRQKRKQQVNEWKAREAREARQKRFERRRGGSCEPSTNFPNSGNGDMRRVVRFDEVG